MLGHAVLVRSSFASSALRISQFTNAEQATIMNRASAAGNAAGAATDGSRTWEGLAKAPHIKLERESGCGSAG